MTTHDLITAIAEAKPEDVPALAMAVAARLAAVGVSLGAASTSINHGHGEEPDAAGVIGPRLTARLPPGSNGHGKHTQIEDRNISAAEAAIRLGMSRDWLYRHAKQLPFSVRIGRRVLFSVQAMERWTRSRATQ